MPATDIDNRFTWKFSIYDDFRRTHHITMTLSCVAPSETPMWRCGRGR